MDELERISGHTLGLLLDVLAILLSGPAQQNHSRVNFQDYFYTLSDVRISKKIMFHAKSTFK